MPFFAFLQKKYAAHIEERRRKHKRKHGGCGCARECVAQDRSACVGETEIKKKKLKRAKSSTTAAQ